MGGKPRKTEIIRQIRKHCEVIGTERDKLRDLHDELSDILETTEDGLRDIEFGIDRLSEHL